uniref:hypothetical protein n=1 Tax=Brucella pseudintermedia TaxID=370111 RepID=UPI00158CEC5F|nr:hypothetical protein [Brucella pseudintermedia]
MKVHNAAAQNSASTDDRLLVKDDYLTGDDAASRPVISHDDAKFDARVLSSIKRLIKRGQLRL